MSSFIRKTCSLAIMLSTILSVTLAFAAIQIPGAADWTDRGTAIVAGTGWDKRLSGAISPSTVIKKNGTYFLYYVGADGDRSTDGGPRNRALGVATSTDGINFTKYVGNPVITHLPHNNQEEGVFSAAATLDVNDAVVLYYGAIWAANSSTSTVDVYAALATSTDGLVFDNRGDIGQYVFKPVGQEVDPIGVMRDATTWYVYYINNAGWKLNLLSGPSIDNLSNVGAVSGTGGSAKGGGDPIFLDQTRFVSFVTHFDTRDPLVVTGSLSNPTALTQVDRYNWGGTTHKVATTYLDKTTQTWFMYYLNKGTNSIGVKTAPMLDDGQTTVTPNPPTNLTTQ